ncbi:PAS domain-containing protein [Desulfohalovibrio reitneri]|uniref:PAS domain-containing protein n=1 Tax=Desulfohalovibrio reitneri TaxID=1307759 RepID=UPI00068D6716|nr:PAS domain-containing protein [Desulfohalovibrio reitneri]
MAVQHPTTELERLRRENDRLKRENEELRGSRNGKASEMLAIAEALPVFIAHLDTGLRFLFANRHYERFFGRPASEIIGRHAREILGEENFEAARPGLEAGLRGEAATIEVPYRFNRQQGFFRRKVTPMTDSSGEVTGLIVMVEDITEWRRLEARSREHESILVQVGDLIPYGFWICNPQGGVEFLSQSFLDMLGRELDSCHEFGWSDHVQDTESDEEWSDCTSSRHDHLCRELDIEDRDGMTRHILSLGAPIRDDSGTVVKWSGVNLDVTERRLEQRQLAQRERRFRTLVEHLPELIVRIGRDGLFKYANPRITDITGMPHQEYIGMPLARFEESGRETDRRFAAAVRRVFISGNAEEHHFRYPTEDGERIFFTSLLPELNADGRPGSVLAVSRDITEQTRMRSELLRAKEEAEAANKAKSDFLANMSHELRTPVTGIMGMAELLLKRLQKEENLDYAAHILSSARVLLELISEVLDISKIEAGRMEIEPRPMELRPLLEQIRDEFVLRAEEQDNAIFLEVDEDVPDDVEADPQRLGQILRNLLSNACKFTREGEIRLSVERNPAEEGEGELLFTVSDSGSGIPEDKVSRIFEEFFQVENVLSKSTQGTGLGLAICKKLTSLMDGAIWFETAEGEGTVFHVLLPLPPVEKSEESTFAKGEGHPADALAQLPPLTVLVAEDNTVNRMFLRSFLEDAGHVVVEALDGLEAVEAVSRGGVDVVLMDVQMPRMNGREAAKAIREMPGGLSGTPIIALTAYAMDGDRERILSHGLDDYVAKPVDFADLARAIRSVLGLS